MKITGVLIIILIVGLNIAAQIRIFKWDDELCRYSGTYDAKKLTLTRLRNTLKLARPGSYSLSSVKTAWKPADIDTMDVAALDREYEQKSAELKGLDIVRIQYWEDLRLRKLNEMTQVYRLNRTTMLGYKDPKALMEYKDAPQCTVRYAEPLVAGGKELLSTWLIVNEDSRTKNSDPERLRRVYEQQLESPDKMAYALIEVMNFGWSNCANELINYVRYDGTSEREFKKLFRRVRTIRCDEP